MKIIYISFILAFCFLLPSREVLAFGTKANWVASGGFGLTVSPTLLMLNPQLEYVVEPKWFVGPMIQMGVGDGVLFTGTATARYLVGEHPRVKPFIEGGVGMAFGSTLFSSSVGIHATIGMGVDFIVEPKLSLGSVIRANFAPPVKTFFASWPLIVGRFAL